MDMDTPWLDREASTGCPFQCIDKEFTVKYREWAVIGHHNIPVHYIEGVENSVSW